MTLTVTQEVLVPVTVEYEPIETFWVEVTAVYVGEHFRTDVLASLDADMVRALEELCVEELEERRAEERISREEDR